MTLQHIVMDNNKVDRNTKKVSIKLLNNRLCKTMNRIIASPQLTISLFLFNALPADFVHDNDDDDDATHVNPKCQGAEYRGAASVCRVSGGGYFYIEPFGWADVGK